MTRDELLDYLDLKYSQTWTKALYAFNSAQEAYIHWNANQDHEAIYDLYSAIRRLQEGMYLLVGKNVPDTGDYALPYFLRTYTIETGGDEFTMGLLLSTMSEASADELKYFIGLNDAYRQSIWDKPFDKEYFAALARGFEQWE